MPGGAVRIDEGAAGIGIRASVAMPNDVEHEFRIVLQLDAEPVPAHLIALKLARSELII